MLITLAHIPPPECPHRHHGAVAISAWPDFVANSSRARRKTRSEPCLGSNHNSAPPGVKSIASFSNLVSRSKKSAVPFFGKSLPVQIVSRGCARLSGRNAGPVLMNDNRPYGLHIVREPQSVYDTKLQLPFGCGWRVKELKISTCAVRWSKWPPPTLDCGNLRARSRRVMILSLSSDSRRERGSGKRCAKTCHPFYQ